MSSEPTIGEYVLGVEGLALLRLAFSNDANGRAARVAEIGDLLDQLDAGTGLRRHLPSEYITVGNSAGLRLRSLEEPTLTAAAAATAAADIVPDADRAAFVGLPQYR
jgi:hypothetical protein